MTVESFELTVSAGGVELGGELSVPVDPAAVVVFAHGSGSSRLSPRNRAVAQGLQARGLATLLFDLLTPDEDRSRAARFDIALLARRLIDAVEWLDRHERIAGLPVGLFGASTGAAAALIAATRAEVGAVVSRGGRVDLAAPVLGELRAPTLLIVGAHDVEVLELNRRALQRMVAPATLCIVPGAGHLFEEPGALAEVQRHAGDWFCKHLAPSRQPQRRWA